MTGDDVGKVLIFSLLIGAILGSIGTSILDSRNLPNVNIEQAITNCSTNDGLKHISLGVNTYASCNNGAEFIIHETK